MEKFFFLTFFLLFCCRRIVGDVVSRRRLNRSTDDSINTDDRIVGGYEISTIQDVPYQVFLLVQRGDNYYQCGGSIISETYILTAAHCLRRVSQVYVRAGSTVTNIGGTLYNTTQYTRHPFYNRVNKDYDVGLVNIPDGITLDGQNTKAVALPNENTTIAPGTNLLITGWGRTEDNYLGSENLKAVQIPTISSDECRKTYPKLTTQQFCAAVPEGGKDSCQGDSGGPAVATDSGVQLGIVSYGEGCGRPGYPGVYTDVTRVRSWIRMNAGV
ncbi:unnamed protein product [Euphydryas editha]|uniref:trypsin n=1 Tax=Euphydryas editha TaxID=104508 RepID=A0AAU9TXC5_EUPED|nr:unnamed protein product [Euphydryas editha]